MAVKQIYPIHTGSIVMAWSTITFIDVCINIYQTQCVNKTLTTLVVTQNYKHMTMMTMNLFSNLHYIHIMQNTAFN